MPSSRTIRSAILLAASVAVAACGNPAGETAPAGLATGYWQATIELPGGPIDTGIEISRSGTKYHASLVNGSERIAIDEVVFEDGELLLRFPAFNNEIRARLGEDGLEGRLTLVKRYGKTQVMPFSARPGATRNAESGSVDVDVSGRWAVHFDNHDGTTSPSIGEFAQRGARLFGTFLNPEGDYRYLSGRVRGNEFRLSTFDGAHAFLFTGRVEKDRIRDGNFWSGTEWHQTFSAVRNPAVTLPDAYSQTHLRPGHERFEFAFPDLAGNVVSLADERFDGKVVVVILSGTWCPNCHDAARLLVPLYRQYREQGLEIVALMYEHFEEPELAAEQVRRFRKKFGIEYQTLLAGVSDKVRAAETLPSLNAVLAFPTTIFIDRGGRVRRIHTGFAGPGTGAHHEKLKQDFTGLVTALLAEPADLIDTLTSSPQEQE